MRPLRRLFGKLAIEKFGPAQLKQLREWMIQPREERDPRTGVVKRYDGWSRKVTNRQIGRVRRIFAWGKEQGIVSDAAYFALQALKPLRPGRSIARDTEPIGPVADDVVAATLPHLSRQISTMVQIQQLTGMRPGEVVAMTTGQLERRGDVCVYQPRKHKTAHHGKKRRIVLGKRAQELLNGFWRLDPDAWLFSPHEAEIERLEARAIARNRSGASAAQIAAVDARKVGKRYTVRGYARAIARACKRAGVEHWHPNQLRHSLATRVRSIEGLGLDAAQAVLGHASSKMTEVYAELRSDELAAKVARAIG
jgi:integrase